MEVTSETRVSCQNNFFKWRGEREREKERRRTRSIWPPVPVGVGQGHLDPEQQPGGGDRSGELHSCSIQDGETLRGQR